MNGDDTVTMLEDCENRESKLTEWEANFISSVRTAVERGNGLTKKQYETLENIWDKATD